jgi:hypothetical protein
MAFRDGLGGEQELARHGREGYLIVWEPEILGIGAPVKP